MKDFVEILGRELDIRDEALMEQDVRLHQVLHYFTQESSINDDLLNAAFHLAPWDDDKELRSGSWGRTCMP